MVVQPRHCWLQDVAGGGRSGWVAPMTVLKKQGRLCLRPSETELPRERSTKPSRVVLAQLPQSLGDLRFGQPSHRARSAQHLERFVGRSETHCTSAIVTNGRRKQRKRFHRRVKLTSPPLEHPGVIR